MKTFRESLMIASFFLCICLVNSVRAGAVNFEDGGYHSVSDAQYQDDFIILDYSVTNIPGTHLELIEGGLVFGVDARRNSVVTIAGGLIEMGLEMHDNSIVTINDGAIGGIRAVNYSTVIINGGTITSAIEALWDTHVIIHGGTINGHLEAYDCIVEISGGTIDHGILARGDATIYLYGSGFSVDGHDLSLGDNLRDYGTIDGSYLTGTITGTLTDGSILNNQFNIRLDDLHNVY